MATILRKLPFIDSVASVEVRGRQYRLFPNQILVWVSLESVGQQDFDPRAPRFPAIIDTGFTDNFLIYERQLREFAGIEPERLSHYREDLRTHNRRLPIRAANLWLHRNRAGQRDIFARGTPFLMELDRGIGVSDDADDFPRLPLLGARALHRRACAW
jgi:hypothetical protein